MAWVSKTLFSSALQTSAPCHLSVESLHIVEANGQGKNTVALHWLGQLSIPFWAGTIVRDVFFQARVTTLGSVVHRAGAGLQGAAALVAGVGIQSVRSTGRLLEHWRGCLSELQHVLLRWHSKGFIDSCSEDPFPSITVHQNALVIFLTHSTVLEAYKRPLARPCTVPLSSVFTKRL